MTTTVDSAFAQFDSNLNLDPDVRAQAQKLHNSIREALVAAGVTASSFLQGSFARKTMLSPLKDVDIVCIIPPSLWEAFSGPDGPALAMETFKTPVKAHWPSVEFDAGDEPSGKALRLSFPGLSFTIDLVPAFEHQDGYVLIGDRHEGTWTPSNARIQLKKVSDRNQNTHGRFVHQVREVKAIMKNQPELDFITGIVIESIVFGAVSSYQLDKHAVAASLKYAAGAVLGSVLEPGGDDDVTVKWSPEERATAARVFAELAVRADEALRLELDDVGAAMHAWHEMAGSDFPAPPPRSVGSALSAWGAGSVSTKGYPSTSREGRQQAAPGRAWSRR
jgi:hypothetical protein